MLLTFVLLRLCRAAQPSIIATIAIVVLWSPHTTLFYSWFPQRITVLSWLWRLSYLLSTFDVSLWVGKMKKMKWCFFIIIAYPAHPYDAGDNILYVSVETIVTSQSAEFSLPGCYGNLKFILKLLDCYYVVFKIYLQFPTSLDRVRPILRHNSAKYAWNKCW